VHGGMKCIKYLLFAFNLLFFLVGLALIITGAVVQTKFKDLANLIGETELSPAYILIAVGVIIFIVAFFGCCGAIKENYCMLTTFAIFLAFIFMLEIAIVITAYIIRNQLGETVTHGLEDSLKHYENSTAVQNTWDFIQKKFHCCGASNYTEWFKHIGFAESVPPSCCKKRPPYVGCGTKVNANNAMEINTKACLDSVKDLLEAHVMDFVIAVIVVSVIQVIGMILGCCLAKNIRKQYEIIQ